MAETTKSIRYDVKIMNGNKATVYPCTHYTRTIVTERREYAGTPDEEALERLGVEQPDPGEPEHWLVQPLVVEPGITLELGAPTRRRFRLPEDGQVAFVTNENGKTIDTLRWPPKGQGGDQQEDKQEEASQ